LKCTPSVLCTAGLRQGQDLIAFGYHLGAVWMRVASLGRDIEKRLLRRVHGPRRQVFHGYESNVRLRYALSLQEDPHSDALIARSGRLLTASHASAVCDSGTSRTRTTPYPSPSK
jgi:hypothetical protein